MEETKHEELPESLPPSSEGKDELNLAEFPLSCVADRSDPDQKTLTFEDKTWDETRGEMITRRLTITGSEEYGLPTALDDEILLGLIQISKVQGFADRRIHFTRYQLIRLLDWRDEGKSYSRIETALNRWVGVTLYYENAWRDRGKRNWANEKFHVLDNVTLFDRDTTAAASQSQLPLSSFLWNDVLFRSFRAGNLKGLDFDFFKKLESSIAKRLFRFLDKRFFHRRRWEFDLKEFAWEHIGLARSYDAAGLKRKLTVGIAELEQEGYLVSLPEHERFKRGVTGQWKVTFEQAASTESGRSPKPSISFESQSLIAALVERQVTPSTAEETVLRHPLDRIRTQLEVFDWLVAKQDPRVSRNPPGFLVSSIRDEYAPPKDFVSHTDQVRRAAEAVERRRKAEERRQRREERESARMEARDQVIATFWNSLAPDERAMAEAEAIAEGELFERKLLEQPGTLNQVTRKKLLDAYALKMVSANS